MITTEYFDEYGNELKPGVRSEHQHNLSTPRFRVYGVLDQLTPERWHAEVQLCGEVIIVVEDQHPTKHQAGAAAEEALRQRLVAIFGASS